MDSECEQRDGFALGKKQLLATGLKPQPGPVALRILIMNVESCMNVEACES